MIKVNFYAIPALQAIEQKVEPRFEAELVEVLAEGGAVIVHDNGALDLVPVTHLRKVQSEPKTAPTKPAVKKTPLTKTESKKSN